jgi:DNA-binding SARP family transcriptional activator
VNVSGGLPDVSFRVLGPVEAVNGTDLIDLGGLKQRAVLALLIINAGRVVSLDRFVSELWDEDPPARATASLQAYVSRLRRLLEPERDPRQPSRLLLTRPPGWLLAVPPEAVDAVEFTRLAADGRRLLQGRQPDVARQVLSDALALWHGPALAEFLPAPFARAEGTRLEELRLTATEDRLQAELDLGQAAAAVAETEALLTEYPYRERLWAQLMLGLYRCGRQADALAAYRRARQRLDTDLGIDPGAELQRLEALILAQAAELAPPPSSAAPRQGTAVSARARQSVPEDGVVLAGRDEVLACLDGVLAALESGQGRLVLVRGSAGIGKSAVLHEVARRGAAAGVAVASGSCPEADTPPVFWPWLQVFRELVETGGAEAVTAAFKPYGNVIGLLDRSLAGLVPLPLPEPAADLELSRTRLFHGLASGVTAFAASRPLIVLLDDMHWADAASMQLFTLLAQYLATAPVVLVAAYRDDMPASSAFSRALDRLATASGVEEITLGGLDREAVAACVQAIAGRTVAPEVAAVMHARTGGNPFFVGELARMLFAERRLDDVAVAAERLPRRVQEVVRRRLARLPEQTRTVLAVAAVAGREFPLGLLERTIHLEQALLFDVVEAAIAAGLLAEDTADAGLLRLRFSHDLVRQTIYDDLSGLRRARLHAQMVTALQAAQDPDPLQVARHARAAVPVTGPREALGHLLSAADWARGRLAFEQAEQLLGTAAGLVAAMPAGEERDRQELEVRTRLGFLQQMLHGYAAPPAREQLEAASALLRRLPLDEAGVRALWHCAGAYWINAQFDQALGLADAAAARARDDEPAMLLAVESIRGAVAWFTGRMAEARARMESVVALAARSSRGRVPVLDFDPEVRGHVFAAAACEMLGDSGAADAHLDAASARAQLADDEFTSLYVLHQHAWTAVVRGDPARAARWAQAELALADRRGYLEFAGKGQIFTAWARAHLGDPGAAAEISSAVADTPRFGMPVLRHFWYRLEAEAKLAAGDPEAALAAADQGLACAAQTGECWTLPDLHVLRAVALGSLGRIPETVHAADAALALAREMNQRPAERKAQPLLDSLATAAPR